MNNLEIHFLHDSSVDYDDTVAVLQRSVGRTAKALYGESRNSSTNIMLRS
jgi:hypothetical protein